MPKVMKSNRVLFTASTEPGARLVSIGGTVAIPMQFSRTDFVSVLRKVSRHIDTNRPETKSS